MDFGRHCLAFAVAERPPTFSVCRATVSPLFPHLANAGATACIACRMASETFLHESSLLLNIGFSIILRVDLS